MNYLNSISDFFKSPKWVTNLLLAGLCTFIPIVGSMVVLGWLTTGFWCRPNATPETFPDFDFAHFGKWLERGLWPILVALAVSVGMYVVFAIPMILVMGLMGALVGAGAAQGPRGAGLLGELGTLIILGLEVFVMLVVFVVLKPLMLRASLTQDFVKAFDLGFIRQFISLTWVELVLSALFTCVASWFLGLAGLLALCVGVLLVPGLIYFMMAHLDQQLYRLYISRGGEPIPLSPKLTGTVGS